MSLRALLIAAVFTVSVVVVDGPAGAETPVPQTLPSLKSWEPGGSGFTLGERPRVVYIQETLRDTALDFAAGVEAVTGREVVVQPGGSADPGDMVLGTGPIDGAPDKEEAYRISVGDFLELRGATGAGVFYATRSALQILRRSQVIPGGAVTDWPEYPERSLMLDVGREFMPVEMLRAQIRRMGQLKLNLLHLHFSDSFGFRLDSDRHPEITAPQHYSKQDIRELIDYAARYQVEIVPEVDFPGHMNAILAAHPELRLRSATGTVSESAIDISDPRSYDLMRDILEEFLPLFPGRYWHLGADEFLFEGTRLASFDDYPQLGAYAKATYGPQAQPVDAYLGLINWGADIVRAHGKRPRIWNDGLHAGEGTLTIGSDIVIDFWSRAGVPSLPLPFFGIARTAPDLIAAGYQVKNAAFVPTYYVTGRPASIVDLPPAVAYELWDPAVFVDGGRLNPEQNVANLGSGLYVWCDDPTVQTPDQISVSITMLLRVMAQKTWGPARAGSFAEFAARSDLIGEPVS
ncbi:glycoside hydrolase family 20 protein [Nocardia sp. NPDC050710]|uniref:beta-N-acetylhexosaminidase n=1 Tax=Nocardia sp. NPDC050710 TaxID=3157220 RepID=UPI0033CEBDCB